MYTQLHMYYVGSAPCPQHFLHHFPAFPRHFLQKGFPQHFLHHFPAFPLHVSCTRDLLGISYTVFQAQGRQRKVARHLLGISCAMFRNFLCGIFCMICFLNNCLPRCCPRRCPAVYIIYTYINTSMNMCIYIYIYTHICVYI